MLAKSGHHGVIFILSPVVKRDDLASVLIAGAIRVLRTIVDRWLPVRRGFAALSALKLARQLFTISVALVADGLATRVLRLALGGFTDLIRRLLR